MIYQDAMRIAEDVLERISQACSRIVIAGSLRRGMPEVHDIEFVIEPKPGRPAPVFGQKVLHQTFLDKLIHEMEDEGRIAKVKGGPKYKQYAIALDRYGMTPMVNPFHVEFWIMTPPAQFGVGLVIRTGPGKPQDNFSRWCVTNRSSGGGLPDGYKQRHLGIWHVEQGIWKGGKFEPNQGETPLPMAQEIDFLDFLGVGWIEPKERHARWRRP